MLMFWYLRWKLAQLVYVALHIPDYVGSGILWIYRHLEESLMSMKERRLRRKEVRELARDLITEVFEDTVDNTLYRKEHRLTRDEVNYIYLLIEKGELKDFGGSPSFKKPFWKKLSVPHSDGVIKRIMSRVYGAKDKLQTMRSKKNTEKPKRALIVYKS